MSGVKAFVTPLPWADRFEIRVAILSLGKQAAATRVEDGRFVYEDREEGSVVEPVLILTFEELKALADVLVDERTPDPGREALTDTRQVRDRLLSLVERLSGVTS